MQSTTNPADVADRLQTYFSRELMDPLKFRLRLSEFAMQKDLPANMGSKIIRFFRKRKANRTGITNLTEGVAITTFTEVAIGYKDVTLVQRGQVMKNSDVLRAIDLFPILEQGIDTMRDDAALDFDTISRNAIIADMLNSDNGYERFSGIVNTNDSSVDFASFHAQQPANAKMTRGVALAAATQLRANNVPLINGRYVAITPPQVLFDMRQDATWVAQATNVSPERLNKWAEFDVDGTLFVEATNPFREAGVYGTGDDTGDNFTTIFLGKDAFACPRLSGKVAGTSPMRPQVVVVDKPDKSDPLNQFITAGWKAFWNAALMKTNEASDAPHAVLVRTKTSFA